VPWLSRQPGIGDVFSFRNERAAKTELVIFIRPTVVASPSPHGDALKFLHGFLPTSGTGPYSVPAGAAGGRARITPANRDRSSPP
jgi:general secretion pathway protein D